MITADQLLAHAIGDYVLQSDWMAKNKVISLGVAAVHASFYVLPFLPLGGSIPAYLIMWASHVIIDRYRLARYVVFLKNHIGLDLELTWRDAMKTGYSSSTPDYLSQWLLIIVDNVLHVTINGLVLGRL